MPQIPLDINDRLQALENRVRALAGAAQTRPALTTLTGGDVSIASGGRLIVTTPTGAQILYIGKQSPSHTDGTDQQGLIVRREDGSVALSVWTSAGSGVQPVQIWDKAGNSIISDDVTAGGLARPYLGMSGWFGAVEQPTFATTSGTFTTVTHLPWIKQHPQIEAYYLVRASDNATSGEIRLVDDSGAQIGPTVVVGLGGFAFGNINGALAGTHEQRMYLHWQARTTAGSGNIAVKGLSTYGVQS